MEFRIFSVAILPDLPPGLPGKPNLDIVGQIDTTDTLNVLGNYDVTAITGTLNGVPIGLLLPNPNQPFPFSTATNIWDNNLLTHAPFVDPDGIGFNFNGDQLVLFSGVTGYPMSEGLYDNNTFMSAIGTLCVQGQCVTPEPATLGLLALGLAGLAFWRRRKLA